MKIWISSVSGLFGFGLFIAGFGTSAGHDPKESKLGSAVLVLSTDCPVAMRYTPRINALFERFAAKGIVFRAIFPNDLETKLGIERYRSERGYAFPCEIDLGAVEARKEGVAVLPSILIFDANGKKVYQGCIDDNKEVDSVKQKYAEDALEAVSAGKRPTKSRTEPFGCVLMPAEPPPSEAKVTYAEHVAAILNNHCVECHRPNEVAPFSLLDYPTAKKWAPMIEQVASSRRMPPWKAVHGYGDFRDENVLSEVEIETLKRWTRAGAPRGSSDKEPIPPAAKSIWPLGEPDLILGPDKEFKLEADGADVYRNYSLKTSYNEVMYVKAMAVKPGNAKIVHHVIAFLDDRGVTGRLDGKDGQPGFSTSGGGPGFVPDGSYGGWAPGLRAQKTPPGIAFELRPGASLVLQVHYHKSGKPEIDQTRIGLYFAKEPINKILNLAWLANPFFSLPAGAEHHVVNSEFLVPADSTLYSVMPHMHLLGRSMKADAVYPDGSIRPLILVDDWDFNWQMNYMFKEPLKLPAGTKVRVEAVYDNSVKNRLNPNNPPRAVTWGEQTTDEMFLMIASYTLDNVRAAKSKRMGFSGG